MTITSTLSRTAAATLVIALSATLGGCAQLGEKFNEKPQAQAEKVEVTETPKPTFAAKEVPLKTRQKPGEEVKDDGLNVQWKLVAAESGENGGTAFKVMLKNLSSDVPVPPDAVNKDVKLSIPGNDNVPRLKTEGDGLDLPLGSLATTTVTYTFNTSPWNLNNAKLRLGNVEFEGSLNN